VNTGDLVNDQHGALRMPNALHEAIIELGRRTKRGKQDLIREAIWREIRRMVKLRILPRAYLPPNWGKSEAGRPPAPTVESPTPPRKRGTSTRRRA
jgi:hypothetical protein